MILNFKKTENFEEIYKKIYNKNACLSYQEFASTDEKLDEYMKNACQNSLFSGLLSKVKNFI